MRPQILALAAPGRFADSNGVPRAPCVCIVAAIGDDAALKAEMMTMRTIEQYTRPARKHYATRSTLVCHRVHNNVVAQSAAALFSAAAPLQPRRRREVSAMAPKRRSLGRGRDVAAIALGGDTRRFDEGEKGAAFISPVRALRWQEPARVAFAYASRDWVGDNVRFRTSSAAHDRIRKQAV